MSSPLEDSGMSENQWEEFEEVVREFHRARESVHTLTGSTKGTHSVLGVNQRATRNRLLRDYHIKLAEAYGRVAKANGGKAIRPLLRQEAIEKLALPRMKEPKNAKAGESED